MIQNPWLAAGTALAILATANVAAREAQTIPPAPNGIEFPADYRDWRVISVAHRTDNNTMRAILGNDVAVAAAREGTTNPWPDGAILGKVVWKQTAKEHWPSAIAPAEFVHAEFMFKDAKRWAETGGWGYARWKGAQLAPYGKDAGFAQECVSCHTPVRHRDYVFTTPAPMPVGGR